MAGTSQSNAKPTTRMTADRQTADAIGVLASRVRKLESMPMSVNSSGAPPSTHASTHENGGSDEIDVGGLSGVLADPQTINFFDTGVLQGTVSSLDVTGDLALTVAAGVATLTYTDSGGTMQGLEDDIGTDVDPDVNGRIKITGGSGLTSVAGTNTVSINVGATDTSISVATDGISVALATNSGLEVATGLKVDVADTSLSLSASGVGISLATNSGLEISSGLKVDPADTSLALSATGVGVSLASPSGLQISSGLQIADTIAGTGLGISAKVLSVNTGFGLAIDGSDNLYVNATSAPIADEVLKGDGSGGIRPQYVEFTGATHKIDVSSGSLRIASSGDLLINPTSNQFNPVTTYDINIGQINKKYLSVWAAELQVETLVAQNTITTIGGRVLVGNTTHLTADLAPGDTTIYVKYNNLANGDVVYMEASGAIEFMAITSSAGGGGPYSYSVTRNLDGTGANQWYAGDAVFSTGTTGDGFIDIYSINHIKPGGSSTADYGFFPEKYFPKTDEYFPDKYFHVPSTSATYTTEGPTIVGNVRNSTTYNDWSEHWAIGNLKGLYDYSATTYGVAFGKYSTGLPWISVDSTNGLRINRSGVTLGKWDTSGNITVGEVASGKSNVYISSGQVSLRNNTTSVIDLLASADAYGRIAIFEGVIGLGTSGGIYQGTGTWSSPTTGMKIKRNSSTGIGEIQFFSGGVKTIDISSSGMNLLADQIDPGDPLIAPSADRSINFVPQSVASAFYINFTEEYDPTVGAENYGYGRIIVSGSSNQKLYLTSDTTSGDNEALIYLRATSNNTIGSSISIYGYDSIYGTDVSYIKMYSGGGSNSLELYDTYIDALRDFHVTSGYGLSVGNSENPGGGEIIYSGDLKARRSTTNYTGYIFVPTTATNLYDSGNVVWDGTASKSTGTYTFLNDTYNSWPSTAKAVVILLGGSWATASSSNRHEARPSGGSTNEGIVTSQVDARPNYGTVIVNCDADGDFDVQVAGANATSCVCRMIGYYI